MKTRMITIGLLASLLSLNAYSESGYERTYVMQNKSSQDAPALAEVVTPQLADVPEDLQIDVLILVDARGRVKSAKVLKSTDERYNAQIKAAARQWRFEPRTREGESTVSKVMIPFVAKSEPKGLAANSAAFE